ncbi:hypothetical protein NQ318_008265 [Aromia moschata]|uniref:GCN5-related N-acetyltransferase Rv2170-like domain-containing protein n=1 Tax=Aromia moschata TaxID=1265417 RepID=A0AAV8XYK6_9CUCU|nr:hypothetical protein NQ318_008265 [Aromia moschata]
MTNKFKLVLKVHYMLPYRPCKSRLLSARSGATLQVSLFNLHTCLCYVDMVFAEDAEMLQLTSEHAQVIHDLYPANHMECIEVFEKLIEKLPCYGIFSANGDLAAWMVQSYYGAMFSMQTRPEYRRKGYGLILAKYLTKLKWNEVWGWKKLKNSYC